MLHIKSVSEKPYLDGVLDDAIWQTPANERPAGNRIELTAKSDSTVPASIVQWARDEQYLYLAIQAAKDPRAKYSPSAARKPRDADLSKSDRLEILIDVDRDYATSYLLAIDWRGWATDICCGNRNWNPTWYIANQQTETGWTIEAAIELSHLAGNPADDSVWAVAVTRRLPDGRWAGWREAPDLTLSRPGDMGLLAPRKSLPRNFGWMTFKPVQ